MHMGMGWRLVMVVVGTKVARLHPSTELDAPRLRLRHCALQLQATRHLLLRLWW